MTYNYTDYNDAENQRSALIPNGTLCKLVMAIRPGGEQSSGGWLTRSQTSEDTLYINAEFTVVEGPYARRKLWQNLTMAGGKLNDKGESIAANISRATLRAILESARNVPPTDMSERACLARRVKGFEEFDGITFAAKVGIEKGKDGYQDKNKIAAVITPDKKEYQAVMSGNYTAPAAGASTQPQGSSAWAGVMSADGENWFALGKERSSKIVRKILIGDRTRALAAANDFLREMETGDSAQKSKRWLRDPATEKQKELLRQVGYQIDPLDFSFTKYSSNCHLNFQWNRRLIEAVLFGRAA